MYGFGDDRNPANDTVNVMEEILVEYIVDVVRSIFLYRHLMPSLIRSLPFPCLPVSDCACAGKEVTAVYRRSTQSTLKTCGR